MLEHGPDLHDIDEDTAEARALHAIEALFAPPPRLAESPTPQPAPRRAAAARR